MIQIRSATAEDRAAIQDLLVAAFPTDGEARLVQKLRDKGKLFMELVAEDEQAIVGHIAFSPISLVNSSPSASVALGLGLAPLCVAPARQRQGIGGRLVEKGLTRCWYLVVSYVVVLGHPHYYGRFGFERASNRHLANEYGVDEPFMVLELWPYSIPPAGGLVQFAPEFAGLES